MRRRELAARLALVEQRLRPIAERPVELSSLADLPIRPSPLDEAGVRVEAERLVGELIEAYRCGTPAAREELRGLLTGLPAFGWAAQTQASSATTDGFRIVLLWLSLLDQGRDPRDLLVTLDHECALAGAAGVDVGAVLVEIAGLSSEADRYGFGSTRDILLHRAGRARAG